MMVERTSGEVVRVSIDLNFANEAAKSFDFLGGFGFERLQVDATLVRYRKSGMIVAARDARDAEALIAQADAAMYADKRSRKENHRRLG